MKSSNRIGFPGGLALAGWAMSALCAAPLEVHLRQRVETAPGTGRYAVVQSTERWEGRRTAVVVCDMWDRHWCRHATARVAAMAPRMNAVLKAARRRGALIIHCPSGTMAFYRDTPQRRRARAAPRVEPKAPLQNWCPLDPAREPPLPIDDSDGGCDDATPGRAVRVYTRQIATLEIAPEDAITDSAEAYYLMRQRGITNVIVMGVHLNMCVLGRPFGIRQLVRQGLRVALMRDLTDTMYNPRRPPRVSHFAGTDLVVAHVEKYWCPTLTSADFVGGAPFRFPADHRPTVALVIGENEYHTWETLPEFAERELIPHDCRVEFVTSSTDTRDFAWANWRALARADGVLLSARRRAAPREMLDLLRARLAAGCGLAGIRTASHAFWVRDEKERARLDARPELAQWPEFDGDVLGGHYHDHHPPGPPVTVTPAGGAAEQPILRGVDPAGLVGHGSLYRVRPLAPDATPLLLGRIPGQPPEPVAWMRLHGPRQARIFYTALGHPEDFSEPAFRRLLLNGVLWTLRAPGPPGEKNGTP